MVNFVYRGLGRDSLPEDVLSISSITIADGVQHLPPLTEEEMRKENFMAHVKNKTISLQKTSRNSNTFDSLELEVNEAVTTLKATYEFGGEPTNLTNMVLCSEQPKYQKEGIRYVGVTEFLELAALRAKNPNEEDVGLFEVGEQAKLRTKWYIHPLPLRI
jgi:hypothetical protein|tara:strand:- start:87 stop:566 length:480 start_codon:yes stop_codon:yes gene_type:complete